VRIELSFDDYELGPDHDASYKVIVKVDDQPVEDGRVEHHVRSHGWPALVQRYLDHRLCITCPGSSSAKETLRS
jgi:hypothetical protein